MNNNSKKEIISGDIIASEIISKTGDNLKSAISAYRQARKLRVDIHALLSGWCGEDIADMIMSSDEWKCLDRVEVMVREVMTDIINDAVNDTIGKEVAA